jgi:Ca-activated chloride channel family protein
MPKNAFFDDSTLDIPLRFRPCGSIRDRLESDAAANYPGLAARLARHRGRVVRDRRPLRWQDRVLLIIGIVLLALVLVRIETAQAQEPAWGLELDSGEGMQVQLALDTEVLVDVTGLVARAAVTQTFFNSSDTWAEGIYRFPLPDGAAVDRLLVQVGERIIEGEIQEKQTARRTYQQAKTAGKTASLVEQQRPNQFETRLANIGPGEEIRITIGFLVNVEYRDGAFALRLPMTFTPRWDPGALTALGLAAPGPLLAAAATLPRHGLEMEVKLRTGLTYAAIESRYHEVDIQPEPDGYRITLAHRGELPDRAFELNWFPDLSAAPQPTLLTWDGGDAVYAQLMVAPPLASAIGPQPREVVFIIDTSGSMEGASIEQARRALLRGLGQLGEDEFFNLIQFNSETERLFPASVPANRANLDVAGRYIEDLVADGGTMMAPALASAFSLPEQPGLLRQVIFVTDGSVGNESELLLAIGEQLGASRLFTVAIGSAPNSWFMRKAAEIGRGTHTHIGRLDEVEERMSQLWTRIRLPALADICVDWGQEAESYPEVIPDLYAGEPLWLVARLPLQPHDVRLCGRLGDSAWEQRLDPARTSGGETLATLWARRKIEFLQDSMVFGVDPEIVRPEITRVALEYGLLTPETSLVAVDRTPVRMDGELLATGEIPSLLPAGSSLASIGFPQTATGWLAQLLLSLLVLTVATGLLLVTPRIARGDWNIRFRLSRWPRVEPHASTDAAR